MKTAKRILAAVLALTMAVSCLGLTAFAADGDITFGDVGADGSSIVVLYTNDVHGGISDNQALSGSSKSLGYAGLAAVKAQAEKTAAGVTLVDIGDAIQGSVVTTESEGMDVVNLMKEVGYDLLVPGNHEFDYGMDAFLDIVNNSGLTYLCANFYEITDPDGTPALGGLVTGKGYEIKEYTVGGNKVKIGFVGIDTPESISKGTPSNFQTPDGNYKYTFDGLEHSPAAFYKTVQDSVDAARGAGAEYIVVMGHTGDQGVMPGWSSYEIIANTTGIDVFLDGHAHSVIEGTNVQNKSGQNVLLTSTGTKLENIGCLKLTVDGSGKVSAAKSYLINTLSDEEKASTAYTDMAAKVKSVEQQYEYLVEVIGRTDNGLYINDPVTGARRIRNTDTNMANFISDAYMWYSGSAQGAKDGFVPADVAFTYGGGVRADIDPGDITYSNVLTVLPWKSDMAEIVATGQQILDFLEMGARLEPAECGGFVHGSGLSYVINMNKQSKVVTDGQGLFQSVNGTYENGDYRVQDVMIGGEPIDLDKEYTIVINNYYYLRDGDGMTMFKGCKLITGKENTIIDIDLVTAYLKEALGGVVPEKYSNPYGQGRILLISSADIAQTDPEAVRQAELTAKDSSMTAANTAFFTYKLKEGLFNYNSKYLYQIALSELPASLSGSTDGTFYVSLGDGEAVAATVNGGYLLFEAADTEGIAAVSFVKQADASDAPQTGDRTLVPAFAVCILLSAASLAVLKKKKA